MSICGMSLNSLRKTLRGVGVVAEALVRALLEDDHDPREGGDA